MRTEHEVKKRLRQALSVKENDLLNWMLETCETCDGRGESQHSQHGGCARCGRVIMCRCNGSEHPSGMGCM